jgi:hypothetical protein
MRVKCVELLIILVFELDFDIIQIDLVHVICLKNVSQNLQMVKTYEILKFLVIGHDTDSLRTVTISDGNLSHKVVNILPILMHASW